MKLGLISDTHDRLSPAAASALQGVDYILHAGDVGQSRILAALEDIAPTTAVLGNTDMGLPLRGLEIARFEGLSILLQHIVDPRRLDYSTRHEIKTHNPDLVVYGHTHRHADEEIGGVRYFNPGSASFPRGENAVPTLAIARIKAGRFEPSFIDLSK